MSPKLIIVNPSDRDHASHRFVLSFGQYSPLHLLVYGHLEDALPEAADYLVDHYPGLVILKGNGRHERDPLLDELLGEVCKERGLAWPFPDDLDWGDPDAMQPYWDAEQEAYADLTDACEDAYVDSDEWRITLEDPTRAELMAFIAELAERHYDDSTPVVAVAGVHDRKPPAESSKAGPTHWVYGSGMVGCLYDYGPHTCESKEDAIAGLMHIFSDCLTADQERNCRHDLESCGRHYFESRGSVGADYCEISEEPGPCPEED